MYGQHGAGLVAKEIPYAKTLQKEFTGNSKIAFVNI
jgi:hypothetical protein